MYKKIQPNLFAKRTLKYKYINNLLFKLKKLKSKEKGCLTGRCIGSILFDMYVRQRVLFASS